VGLIKKVSFILLQKLHIFTLGQVVFAKNCVYVERRSEIAYLDITILKSSLVSFSSDRDINGRISQILISSSKSKIPLWSIQDVSVCGILVSSSKFDGVHFFGCCFFRKLTFSCCGERISENFPFLFFFSNFFCWLFFWLFFKEIYLQFKELMLNKM
jgi:hypothetical protein